MDGNTATCMRTIVIGTGLSTPDKTVWWKVDLGGVYNIYRISILFKNYDGYGVYYLSIESLFFEKSGLITAMVCAYKIE